MMKIALVTAFPPSRQGLNEYGFHIANELRQQPGLELTILGDYIPEPVQELEGFSVTRCWGFNRLDNTVSLLRAIRKVKPDVAWYNLGFASFGGKPIPAFFGLTSPALTRLCSCYTHVTLHQLFETVSLQDAGVKKSASLYRAAGRVATHLLLSANSMSVLLPAYHRTLREKYGRGIVNVRHHGIFASRPEAPDFSLRGNPVRVLAFGKWGTYKRLEALVAAFEAIQPSLPKTELVIAGGDHPKTPGYVRSVAERVKDNPQIKFLGYVAEADLPGLFRTSSLTVLPYTSSAGSSGVAHLACQYGLPILAPDIEDFVELAEQEMVSMEFFAANNATSLAEQLLMLLQSPDRLAQMAQNNFRAALQMSMPQIIQQYVRSFDMQQRVRILKAYSQLRRTRRWAPARNWTIRQLERNLSSWRHSFPEEADS